MHRIVPSPPRRDRVPAFSADKSVAIIERDLGQPIDRLFKKFDRRPIAAASLGQVHRAVTFSGDEVVVKVQRPGLKQLFDIDLEVGGGWPGGTKLGGGG
eukprot:352695-Chlamydomonas_euryale.AAC.9